MRLVPQRRGPRDSTGSQVSIALIALGSLLVALASAFSPHREPHGAVLILGLSVAGLGVVGVVVTAALAVARWVEDRKRPLTLHFDRDDPECYEDQGKGSCIVRVRVVNGGRVALRQVRARLTVLEPTGLGADHYLRIQNDNSPNWVRSWDGENVQIGEPVVFEVLRTAGDSIVLNFAGRFIKSGQISLPVDAVIRVTASAWLPDGRDVPRTRKKFRITAAKGSPLSVTELAATNRPARYDE
jgi:hypothetical protein